MDLIGKMVLVRCTAAGVLVGTLTRKDSEEVDLQGARRLWRWQGADGAFEVGGLATLGIESSSTVGHPSDVTLRRADVCEIHAMTEAAVASVAACPPRKL